LDWHPSAMTHFPSMKSIDFLWTISDLVMNSF
jgi:hypothetical protein